MKSVLKSLRRDTRGTSSVEYALICGFIVLTMLIGLRGFAQESGGIWGNISTKSVNAMQGSGG